MSVAWVGVAASVAGAAMSANSSSKANKSQQAAANSDRELQAQQFERQVELQEPFRETGLAANNRLSYLLGLDPNKGQPGVAPGTRLAGMDLVNTSGGVPSYNKDLYSNNEGYRKAWDEVAARHQGEFGNGYTGQSDSGWIDREVRALLAPQLEQERGQGSPADSDPQYGSLLRNFGQSDLDKDVVYQSGLQFGLNEGTKGIERQASATGSKLSGATLKALARFGNDYGSTKAGDSYNRFKNDQNSIYNKLAGVSGAGQQATTQIGNASQQYANNMSNNIIGAGNARAASSIAQGNAWQNGMNGAVSGFRNSQQPATGNGVSQSLFNDNSGFGSGAYYGNQDLGQYL